MLCLLEIWGTCVVCNLVLIIKNCIYKFFKKNHILKRYCKNTVFI